MERNRIELEGSDYSKRFPVVINHILNFVDTEVCQILLEEDHHIIFILCSANLVCHLLVCNVPALVS